MKTINTKYLMILATVITLSGMTFATVSAQTSSPSATATGSVQGTAANSAWQGRSVDRGPGMMNGMRPGVAGTVTAVSGTTLTVQSGFGQGQGMKPGSTPVPNAGQNTSMTPKTYTVDASGATVMKNNATSTLGAVAVGDRVFIQGTVSGSNVTATMIRDGLTMRGKPGMPGAIPGSPAQSPVKGNGQPVVAGTVATVSGNNLTITTSSNTSYTVDASAATITKAGAASTVSAVAVGDYVVVQGTVNGSAVTAHSVMDQPPHSILQPAGSNTSARPGFFGTIGNFFKNLFGF
jgi:hypothetical protein